MKARPGSRKIPNKSGLFQGMCLSLGLLVVQCARKLRHSEGNPRLVLVSETNSARFHYNGKLLFVFKMMACRSKMGVENGLFGLKISMRDEIG